MSDIPWLTADSLLFPDPERALLEPNGLLAAGGDLTPERLIEAYKNGIFPWFEDDQPILWWSPDPRTILLPDKIRISRSLRKTVNKGLYKITFDQAFDRVVEACSESRDGAETGTWITAEMKSAYQQLFNMGLAHSVEAWHEGALVGGLYGVSSGKVFSGESMFSRKSNASKVALVHLCAHLDKSGYYLIDCQVNSQHLKSLGAFEIPRKKYLTLLNQHQSFTPVW